MTCDPEYRIPVSAGDKFERDEGASQTLQAALSVQGFVGAVTTGITGSSGGHTSPMLIGEEYDHFSVLLFNRGQRPIELERVRLTGVAGPVELVGVRGRRANEEFVGGAGGGGRVTEDGTAADDEYPSQPLEDSHTLSAPREYREGGDPVQAFQILFRIKMSKAGVAHSDGVEIDYRSGDNGYSETFAFRSTWCAPRDEYAGPTAQDEVEHGRRANPVCGVDPPPRVGTLDRRPACSGHPSAGFRPRAARTGPPSDTRGIAPGPPRSPLVLRGLGARPPRPDPPRGLWLSRGQAGQAVERLERLRGLREPVDGPGSLVGAELGWAA